MKFMEPMKNKRECRRLVGKLLFILYVAFLIYFLLFSDWYGRSPHLQYRYNLVPLKEIKRFWEYREVMGMYAVLTNLVGNILIFIPFGFFLPMGSAKKSFAVTTLLSFFLSLGIETFQLLTKIGSFDVDDLLLNTLGGIVGYLLYRVLSYIRRRMYEKETKAGKN